MGHPYAVEAASAEAAEPASRENRPDYPLVGLRQCIPPAANPLQHSCLKTLPDLPLCETVFV